MGTERKTFKYNGTTIFYWNRHSRKSFLDKAVNVWVLYPEPNKKTSQLLILRRTLLECLILWWKASTQIQGPISHSVFETLTTQRGSNRFICLMSIYFLLSVGSKIEAFFDERKARTRRVPVPPNKEQKKKLLMKTPACWRRDACLMVALSDNTDIKRSRSGPRHSHMPLPQDCPLDRSSTVHVWVVFAHVRNNFVKI